MVPARNSNGAVSQHGETPMAKFNLFGFLQDVRSEAQKVTWPTRRETMITTGLVFVMVIVSSIFFFFVDSIIRWVLALVLGIGR